MKKTTRLIALALSAMMLIPAFTACKGNVETTTGASGNVTGTPDSSPQPGMIAYSIVVKTDGGMAVEGVKVTVVDAQGVTASDGTTDKNGKFDTWLFPAEYEIKVDGLRPGYHAPTTPVKTNKEGGEQPVTLTTAIIGTADPNPNASYQVGDVLYDFTVVQSGKEVKLSELLKTKKLVVLNFWATWCGPCRSEFPAINEAYGEYKDSVEVLALSISDSNGDCEAFRVENGLDFPMLSNTGTGLYNKFTAFSKGAIPLTVFIDRYGVFVNYVAGADPDAEAWKKEFAGYTADNYVPVLGKSISDAPATSAPEEVVKPDVSMPASSEIEAAINGSGFKGSYSAPTSDTVWPWVLSSDKKSITPANFGKHSTAAMISTEVTLNKGQVFAFDYTASIELQEGSVLDHDVFYVYIDGMLMTTIRGLHENSETCYVYTPVADGTHQVTLYYIKDSADWYLPGEKEYLKVSNLRVVNLDDVIASGVSMNVYRRAATEPNTADGATTGYLKYVDVVLSPKDNYYHVGTVDGPLLLASLMSGSAWSSTSIYNLALAGYLTIDGVDYSAQVTDYAWLEDNSDLRYCPVDSKLADLLDLIVSSVADGPNHDKEWLEACCYFEHYGAGKGVTEVRDVRNGITYDSAFTAKLGTNHVVVDRVLVPRGLIYAFTPDRDGVYTFHGVNPEGGEPVATEAWFYESPDRAVDSGDGNYTDGTNFLITYSCKAGHTYYIRVAFDTPDTLAEFDFVIEYVAAKLDVMTPAEAGLYTTDDSGDTTVLKIIPNYGFRAALGTDGYYHQVLSYKDGQPVLDYSEKGYVYIDFVGTSTLMSYIPWLGSYCTLEKYINENGKSNNGGFDFTIRTDSEGNSLAELGNYQAKMEAYLAKALAATGDEAGYARADKELVDILNSTIVRLYGEPNVVDQWYMLASFFRHL